MEICWLTTGRCNQHCNYCDRFPESVDFSLRNYQKIMDKIIDYGVKQLTFGGGESLLVSCFNQIIKTAVDNDIHIKLVTNGKLIPQYSGLVSCFDEITLSIDSVDSDTNEKLGRGRDHLNNICSAVNIIKENGYNTRININTVVTKVNFDKIIEMKNQIAQWEIQQWRIFRFSPLRGTALRNRAYFEISDKQFEKIQEIIKNMRTKCNVQFRDYVDMENKYLLITPNGKLCISRNMEDIVLGDMIRDDLRKWFL